MKRYVTMFAAVGLSVSADALAQDAAAPDLDGLSYAVTLYGGEMCRFHFMGEGEGAGSIYATCTSTVGLTGRVARWSVLGQWVTFNSLVADGAYQGDGGATQFFASECESWTPIAVGDSATEVCWISDDSVQVISRLE